MDIVTWSEFFGNFFCAQKRFFVPHSINLLQWLIMKFCFECFRNHLFFFGRSMSHVGKSIDSNPPSVCWTSPGTVYGSSTVRWRYTLSSSLDDDRDGQGVGTTA